MSIKTLIGSMIFGLAVFFGLAYYSETYAAVGVIAASISTSFNFFGADFFEVDKLSMEGFVKPIIAAAVIAASATMIGLMYSFFVAAVVLVPIYLITLPMNKSFKIALQYLK